MNRFLFDTGIASDYINRRHGVFDRARVEVAKGNTIGIRIPVLAELIAGIEKSKSRDRNMKTLKTALAALKLWPMDAAGAFEYGRIYAELASLGRPIGAVDMMVAAIAKTLGNCSVISADSDYSTIRGLEVDNWRQ